MGVFVSVPVGVGVSVGKRVGDSVQVAVGVEVGVLVFGDQGGTTSFCPTRILDVFRQLACCNSPTVIPYNWLIRNSVSPVFTI